MIIDLNQAADLATPRYDVCVIGAGAAGMTLARALSSAGKRVALCEAGGLEVTAASQDCYAGDVIGDPYFDLDFARLRFLGGSTNHWGGMCRSFEAVDFERGYVSETMKWPIEKADIDSYLNGACEILEIAPPVEGDVESVRHGIRNLGFSFSPPVRFGEKYLADLTADPRIDLILNANLTKLGAQDNAVRSARFASYDTPFVEIEADAFVFAMGGIENSRQLLWQREIDVSGLFAPDLPIGAFWMEHPHFTLGEALVEQRISDQRYFGLTARRQRELGVLNCGLRVQGGGRSMTRRLVKDLLCVAPKLGAWAASLADRNLICGVGFRAAWEQAPIAENRVTLSSTGEDSFGVPRVKLHWRKGALDRKTIKLSTEVFNYWLLDAEIGRLKPRGWVLGDEDYPEDDELAGYHHMGGTRMAADRRYGVVDANGRVFGTKNLYVAGSSVFTTGGHNNPTLPIVQLALRLADHLV